MTFLQMIQIPRLVRTNSFQFQAKCESQIHCFWQDDGSAFLYAIRHSAAVQASNPDASFHLGNASGFYSGRMLKCKVLRKRPCYLCCSNIAFFYILAIYLKFGTVIPCFFFPMEWFSPHWFFVIFRPGWHVNIPLESILSSQISSCLFYFSMYNYLLILYIMLHIYTYTQNYIGYINICFSIYIHRLRLFPCLMPIFFTKFKHRICKNDLILHGYIVPCLTVIVYIHLGLVNSLMSWYFFSLYKHLRWIKWTVNSMGPLCLI